MVTFVSTESSEFGKGEEEEKNSFIPTSGPEKGVLHHFTTEDEVSSLMSKFKQISLSHYKHGGLLKVGNYVSAHWIFVGKK